MLHRRERLIEVMQQAAPTLIIGRLPEANRVVFETPPMHQQKDNLIKRSCCHTYLKSGQIG